MPGGRLKGPKADVARRQKELQQLLSTVDAKGSDVLVEEMRRSPVEEGAVELHGELCSCLPVIRCLHSPGLLCM